MLEEMMYQGWGQIWKEGSILIQDMAHLLCAENIQEY